MVKYFLYGFSSFLFLTNAYAGSQPESLAKIIYEKEIDLNQDRIKDKLVIEENTEGKRNLKILVEDSKNSGIQLLKTVIWFYANIVEE